MSKSPVYRPTHLTEDNKIKIKKNLMKTNEKLIYLTIIYKNKFLICGGIIFIHGTDFHVRPWGQTLFGNLIYQFNPVFLGIYLSIYQSISIFFFPTSL